jgi:hypothetical protein
VVAARNPLTKGDSTCGEARSRDQDPNRYTVCSGSMTQANNQGRNPAPATTSGRLTSRRCTTSGAGRARAWRGWCDARLYFSPYRWSGDDGEELGGGWYGGEQRLEGTARLDEAAARPTVLTFALSAPARC